MSLKVVFDTNIFISAIIFGGNPRMCLEFARLGEIKLYTSRTILFELAFKLQHKFRWSNEDIHEVVSGIGKFAEVIIPKETVHLITSDSSDNHVLEVAQEIEADYIITGDKKHILPLKKIGSTKIITAAEFLKGI